MKKLSIIIIAAIAMVSCGKTTYTAEEVTLNNQTDSLNYALGLMQGSQIKMHLLRNDSSTEAIAEFVEALERGYNGEVEQLEEIAAFGKNIGMAAKQFEKEGLAAIPQWSLNQKLFFQGLVNGLNLDSTVMKGQDAALYFQNEYQAAALSNDTTIAAKPILGKCPKKVKTVTLNDKTDSLNYAFGYINGAEIGQYILAEDSTGEDQKLFIKYINIGRKSNIRNPQLVNAGEQIGKGIKGQESAGLFGEPTLITNFELIKKGFINGLLDATEQWNPEFAGEYIQSTMANIKYGNSKNEGEKFLEENKLREGVITTASGLQYEVLVKGKGKKTPTATDKVKVHYHGTLTNGVVFDSSVDRDEPITFGLTQVIPGWTEGLQLMTVGSKYKFYIPSHLGYGSQQAGSIPPYSVLIFEVELLGIEK
jgi:FKBP-type peptidyl-prolyl cis-trans isomerase FklB